ncbi:MAG: FAD-dependent oxidoreductase [Oscillospiraceae bacterium]|nr:FAD-dependent oxidoreductase [Oscillospiraceae bacterium]
MCSCCHRCRVLCPNGAITFKGTKYWIDPDKCVECGICEKNCHNAAIILPGAPVRAPELHEVEDTTCDVAVVGAGGSGLIAAVRLAQAGLSVVVLEKNREAGGNTWYAGGFHGHYSRYLKEAGEPDRRDETVAWIMEHTKGLLDGDLVHNAIYASADMMDFLIDHCDCAEDFTLGDTPFGGKGFRFQNRTGTKYKRIDASIGPGGMGSYIIEKLMGQCEKLQIPVRTSCAAEELRTTPGGAVCGVLARDPGGAVEIHCKAVVMAAGSYSHNPEYQNKANPRVMECKDPAHLFSIPTCTGDGITMSEKIGAEIDWEHAKAMLIGPAHHPFGFAAVCITRENEVVLVNRDGKRWASEVDNTMSLREVILDQPDRICWAILDQGTLDYLAERLMHSSRMDGEHAEIISHYQEEVDAEAKMDTPVKKADTLEELANLMGVPAAEFAAEIRNYNRMCEQGCDTQFGKPAEFLHPMTQPPYYAFYEKMFQENAAGGIKTDAETRVLDQNGKVIPGLFAVGDNAAGLMLGTGIYAETLEREMSMFTWALTSGYMAAGAVINDLK